MVYGNTFNPFRMEIAEAYLSSKGLKVELETAQPNVQEVITPEIAEILGIPATNVDTSVEKLKDVTRKALDEGASVQFSINGGDLINLETDFSQNYNGKGHAFRVVDMNDDGFIVSTYGDDGKWLYPYDSVKTNNDGGYNVTTVGYSVVKVMEID